MDFLLIIGLAVAILFLCFVIQTISMLHSTNIVDGCQNTIKVLCVFLMFMAIPISFLIQNDKQLTKLKKDLYEQGITFEKVAIKKIVGYKFVIKKIRGEK